MQPRGIKTLSPIAHDLADFVLDTSWNDLPHTLRSEAVRAFLNFVGCALGGSNTTTIDAAMRGVSNFAGQSSTPVLGRREHLDPVNAALINCTSSAAHAFDDTHLKSITHPTGPVAAAALALAATQRVSGLELLTALMLGMEVECRISTALTTANTGLHGGWYMTGIAGGIGAAAAAGRLMALDHERLVSALGLAATQACGLRATHGSMATAYVPGLAARNGLTAACMAAAGFQCTDFSLDGRNGLCEVMAPRADASIAVSDLGTTFEVLNNAYKPYPCGIVIHPSIDACVEIATRHAPAVSTIADIDLEVHPDALRLTWRKLPHTELDAQVSLYHWAAAALVHAKAELDEGALSCIQDARVRSLQSRMTARANDSFETDQATATIRMESGEIYRAHVAHAIGSVQRPMTNDELSRKFLMLAKRVCSPEHAKLIERSCWDLPSADDAGRVARLATPAGMHDV